MKRRASYEEMLEHLPIQRVIYYDFETSDRLKEGMEHYPEILEFGACIHNLKTYHSFITPKVGSNFRMSQGAMKKNGLSKEALFKMPADQRPTFDKVWADFLDWLSENGYDLKKHIVFCAFSGFTFDHKLLVHHLKQYNIALPRTFLLIDP